MNKNQYSYDIQFNKLKGLTPLNDGDIPPFDDVVKAHTIWLKKTRLQMVIRYSLSCVAAIAITLGVWSYLNSQKQVQPLVNTPIIIKDSSVVKAPVAAWDIPYQSFTINADSLSIVTMPSGTSLTISPNTLTDSAGNLVKGEVKIDCREFRDPIDIMVAGIPMQYDSGGVQYTLETAGMLEVNGSQNNRKLKIADGKSITVAQVSRGDNSYNTYSMDAKTGKWTFEGKPEVQVTVAPLKAMAIKRPTQSESLEDDCFLNMTRNQDQLIGSIDEVKRTKNIVPALHNESNRSFRLDVDKNTFPELAIYNNVLFEIKPGQNFNSNNEEWDWIDLKPGKEANEYKVFLHDKGKTLSAFVTPVFSEGADYNEALKTFKKHEIEELVKIEEKRKQVEERQRIVADEQKKLIDQMAKDNKAHLKALEKLQKKNKIGAAPVQSNSLVQSDLDYGSVTRTFTMSKFGYYNSDRPYQFKNPISTVVTIETDIPDLRFENLYQIEIGTNTLMVNYGRGTYNVIYNPSQDNMLFTIIPGSKRLAVMYVDDFAKQMSSNIGGVLKMKIIEIEFENTDEIRSYLFGRKI